MKIKKLLYSLLMCGLLLPLNSCKETDEQDTTSKPPLFTTTAAQSTQEQQTYIKDIKAVGAYWDKYAYNGASVLNNKYGGSYSRLSDWNLNCDCGTTTDCIYLYEQRTIHAEEAITNIIAVTQKSISKTFKYNDHNYEVVGGMRVNGLNSSKTEYQTFDLNMNAGGDYIYLCVSHDQDFGKPITKLTVGGASALGGYNDNDILHNMTTKTEFQNFNAGAGGTAIYAAVSCAITGWIINDITLVDRNIYGKEITKTYTLDTANKCLSTEQLQPIIDKGEGAYFQGFNTKKVEEGEMVTTNTKFPYDYTIWSRWKYDITIDYTQIGGGIESYSQVTQFPYLDEFVWCYYVLEETGEKVTSGLCWPGTYIAIPY